MSRERAGLRAPTTSKTFINRPAKRAWIHHTVGEPNLDLSEREVHRKPKWSERYFFRSMCRYWREVQAFHQDVRGWSDVGYSFGVAPGLFGLAPRVFVGRGLGVLGAHTEGDNDESYGIVVFGNYDERRLPRFTRRKIRRLLDELVAEGELEGPRRKQPAGGHQNAPGAATRCPGRHVMKHIHTLRKPIRSRKDKHRG